MDKLARKSTETPELTKAPSLDEQLKAQEDERRRQALESSRSQKEDR